MLIPAILLSLVESYLAFDLPVPSTQERERPEVAFYQKRLSKYYDLETGTWRDSDVRQASTYRGILKFCQDMYPDIDVKELQQGPPRVLMFCKIRDRTKCSEHDSVTWICVSSAELITEVQTASPPTTASHVPIPPLCGNETTTSVSYQTCTAIETFIYSNPCPDKMVFKGMENLERCNLTASEGGESSGLLSADLKCCLQEQASIGDPFKLPDIATLPRYDPNRKTDGNPFMPWSEGPSRTNSTVHPDLPREWCGLEQVEAKEKNLTNENVEVMKQIYTANQNSDGTINSYSSLLPKINQVKRDMNRKKVLLYRDHFACLEKTLRDLINDTQSYMSHVSNAKAKKAFTSDVTLHNNTLLEVRRKFEKLCSDLESEEANDINRDYRGVVTELQMLRMNIENINTAVKSWDSSNCINCHTTQEQESNTLPPAPLPTSIIEPEDKYRGQETEKKNEQTKLNNQKYLIAIVSTVSVITIIVALIFFIVVVRRTLRKDASTGRFTSLPATDELTGDQYVAFLQKNGYANPTCRLPQKYLDDHD